MERKEYISKHLGVPYVFLPDLGKYICSNGVVFTKEEYLDGIDLKSEYEKREASGEIYDYAYARSTGLLRKKAVRKPRDGSLEKEDEAIEMSAPEEVTAVVSEPKQEKTAVSVTVMCLALALTSLGSMYISTVHTATYLLDYVDVLSAWLMSGVITVYCSTAFEVVILFHDRRRQLLSCVFAFLWALVITFSMTTTVSVFYDRYNFSVVEAQEEGREADSARLSLDVLRKKEAALREDIEFKRKDIEYRQSRDYATTAVRLELERLQEALQQNLAEQEMVVSRSPEAAEDKGSVTGRESLFAFLGRLLGLEGGILEFIMSTLSAVFINLISPLSVSVVVSLLGGMRNESGEGKPETDTQGEA